MMLCLACSVVYFSEHQSIPADTTHSGFTNRWYNNTNNNNNNSEQLFYSI